MYRTRLAAASLLTLGMLAPAALATSASATTPPSAPVACTQAALHKDFRLIKKAESKGKKTGHAKLTFVNAGKVTSVDTSAGTLTFTVKGGKVKEMRGCELTVTIPKTAKILRNKKTATLSAIVKGDHVNVKGVIAKDATTHDVTFTATRVEASAKH